MSARKLHLYWAAVLACVGSLSAAPASSGGELVPSDHRPVPASAYSNGGPTRWGRPNVARSWKDRTPAAYRDKVRQVSGPEQKALLSQHNRGHSRFRGNSGVGGEAASKTQPRAKAIVSGVWVAEDKWRDGYDVMKSHHQSMGHDRASGASRQPGKPAQTWNSPKLSYIQRRRPFGAAATAGMFRPKATRGTVRPAAPPRQAVLTSMGRPEATSTPRPAATSTKTRPRQPPLKYPIIGAEYEPIRGKPLSTKKKQEGSTKHAVLKNWQPPPINPKDRLEVINAAGLVPGSVIYKKLSVGLSVPHYGRQPAVSRPGTTTRPNHTHTRTATPESIDRFNTNTPRNRIPHTTRSPVLTPKGNIGPAPPVEVLNLYEVGVLPNASGFFQHQKSGDLRQKGHGQTDDRTRGVSGGGGSKGSTKVTFPLYVLPASAPVAASRPGPARPCCNGRPGLVLPVEPPYRPVYPSIGSGHHPRPPPTARPATRPVVPPSSSYQPPTPPSGPTRPSGHTYPSGPTDRPCGTNHCVYLLPPPSVPHSTLPPAPPSTAIVTALGSVGSDLVCVYLRSNGSALVLRADLHSGRYNISDDQNHLLSSSGWLGSNKPQLRDRPSHQHQYDIVYIDNQTTTVQQLLTRMRNRTERWEETKPSETSIVCIVQRPETTAGNETSGGTTVTPLEPTEPPKPSEEPVTPTLNPTSTSQSTPTTTPKPTILGAVDSLSTTIASAVDTLGATAEAQLATTMSVADQTAVVIGSNVKNYIGTSIPSLALATTVGIPVFVAMLALLGAPPLLLSALSVSSPLLLQGVAAIYNSLPN